MGTMEKAPELKWHREQKIRTEIAIDEAFKELQASRNAANFGELEKLAKGFIKNNPNKSLNKNELLSMFKKKLAEESKKSKQDVGKIVATGSAI